MLPQGLSFKTMGNGTATISGTPRLFATGTYKVTITATNAITPKATQTLTIVVGFAPAYVTRGAATFTVGTHGFYLVGTLGYPVATLTDGPLPTGLRFKTNGNGTASISGTPVAGTGGVYKFTIAASNHFGTIDQSFTLTVDQAPAFTSHSSTTFKRDTFDIFTVKTSGYPVASITEAGVLPRGVSFKTNENGSATISGTPATTRRTTYVLRLTAVNGVGRMTTQTFILTVTP